MVFGKGWDLKFRTKSFNTCYAALTETNSTYLGRYIGIPMT